MSPIAISRRARRSFIVADSPGHEQYTRNMATGASTADLAVLLVDARKGVLAQTRRHSLICSLFGIRHVVLAVNKLDLVGFDRAVFDRIAADYAQFAADLRLRLGGDDPAVGALRRQPDRALAAHALVRRADACSNISRASTSTDDAGEAPFRFPVQWVNRPNQRLPRLFRHGRDRIGGAGRPGRA